MTTKVRNYILSWIVSDRSVHEHIQYQRALNAAGEHEPLLQVPGFSDYSTLLREHPLDRVWHTHHSVTQPGAAVKEHLGNTDGTEVAMLAMNSKWHTVSFVPSVHEQIRKLESSLMDMDNKTLWNDYRMAQPLNDRVVESSFLPRLGKGSMWRVAGGCLNTSGNC